MEKTNCKNLQGQQVAATTKKVNTRLLFSSCGCTQELKLKIEWQMAFLSKKVNIDFINEIASLAALQLVRNFKLCNKYQTLLVRYLGIITKKVPKENIALQLDGI